jgi:hypothetical protein
MKNPMVYYAAIGLGIIALAAGGYLFATATAANPYHISKYVALGVGAVLLIGGAIGWFVMKPSASAK